MFVEFGMLKKVCSLFKARAFVKCFAFAVLFACGFSNNCLATDRAILDSLVEKGILTQTEASEIAKSMVSQVSVLRPTTQAIALSLRSQFQGEWVNSSAKTGANAPQEESDIGIVARRVYIQVDSDVGAGWKARFSADIAGSKLYSFLNDNYLAKDFDGEYLNGNLTIGHMKPGMCVESMKSSFSLNAIERSAVTRYWTVSANGTLLGIGDRYVGVRWLGNVKQVKGLSYNLAITNAFHLNPHKADALDYNFKNNSPAYWFGLHYELERETAKIKFGVYSMYSESANQNMGLTDSSSVYTINPYYTGNWGKLYFWGDFITSGVADGKKVGASTVQANPYGINFSLEYRFDIQDYGELAPTFRYSWLDTGGRGVAISDIQRHSTSFGDLYNNAQDFYIGLNWYLRGDDLKVQLGFSYIQYSGSPDNKHSGDFAESSALRTQFQIKF